MSLRGTHGFITISGFIHRLLPVQESNGIWISHTERNELYIRPSKVLLFQSIHCTLSVFLCHTFSAHALNINNSKSHAWGRMRRKTG